MTRWIVAVGVGSFMLCEMLLTVPGAVAQRPGGTKSGTRGGSIGTFPGDSSESSGSTFGIVPGGTSGSSSVFTFGGGSSPQSGTTFQGGRSSGETKSGTRGPQ
jgi:hypothetical protein